MVWDEISVSNMGNVLYFGLGPGGGSSGPLFEEMGNIYAFLSLLPAGSDFHSKKIQKYIYGESFGEFEELL
ncbi:MAG TPA: hypothetical protein PLZ42_03130 [Methanothrix sp.]|nr:hypothetical protein [Methanothrix sp.]